MVEKLNTGFIVLAVVLAVLILLDVFIHERVDRMALQRCPPHLDHTVVAPVYGSIKRRVESCGRSFCKGVFIGLATAGSLGSAIGTGITFSIIPVLFDDDIPDDRDPLRHTWRSVSRS